MMEYCYPLISLYAAKPFTVSRYSVVDDEGRVNFQESLFYHKREFIRVKISQFYLKRCLMASIG